MVHLTFWWKYRVCGFKIEISGYPLNSLIITYPPYKYEVDRIKTHEMRAKFRGAVFFSVHCTISFIGSICRLIQWMKWWRINKLFFIPKVWKIIWLKFQLKNSPPFGWRIFYVGIPFYFLSYTGNILILMILPVYERKWYPDRSRGHQIE